MAIIGFSAKLEVNTGASQAYDIVDQSTMISIPFGDVTTVETTWIGQSSTMKTFTPGLVDPGEMTFEANYTKAIYNKLVGIRGKLAYGTPTIPPSGAAVQWKITAPDEDGSGAGTAQTFTFGGILTKLETSLETENIVKMKGTVKLSGDITVA